MRRHEKLVLSLNHTMEEKAAVTVYINETYTKINSEKKELEFQNQRLKEIQEQMEKEKAKYLARKQKLNQEVSGAISFLKKIQNCTESQAGKGKSFTRSQG